MARPVLEEDRAVAAEFQLDDLVAASLHSDRVSHDPQRFPRPVESHLVPVRRVDLFDVDVFLVGADDREAPRDAFVVPERHAHERRLGGADDVPARRLEVHDVAQGRIRHLAMRIVGDDRMPRRGTRAAHDPVVAAGLADWRVVAAGRGGRAIRRQQRRERLAPARHARAGDHVIRDGGDIQAVRHREIVWRIGIPEAIGFPDAEPRDVPRQLQLAGRVAERRRPQHELLDRPRFRRDTRDDELHGQVVRVLRDERVHAVREGGEDPLSVRVIAGPLDVVERPAVFQQPRGPIAGDSVGPGDLGEATLGRPTPDLHLPQPVLRHDVALGEEEIIGGLRGDVRHAPRVADNLDGRVQPGDLQVAVNLRERRLRQRPDIRCRLRGKCRTRNQNRCKPSHDRTSPCALGLRTWHFAPGTSTWHLALGTSHLAHDPQNSAPSAILRGD